jgi:hypothetical protein
MKYAMKFRRSVATDERGAVTVIIRTLGIKADQSVSTPFNHVAHIQHVLIRCD